MKLLASMEFSSRQKPGINVTKKLDLFPLPSLEAYAIAAAPFLSLAQEKNTQVFSVSIKDIEKALALKIEIDPATVLPSKYHKFLDICSYAEAQKLPEHHIYDPKITLTNGKSLHLGRFTKCLGMS